MSLFFDATNNSISINGESISGISSNSLEFLSSDILQIYWYDTYGELKYKDKSVEFIDELEVYGDLTSLFFEEKEKLKEKEKLDEVKKDEGFQLELKKREKEKELEELKYYEKVKLQDKKIKEENEEIENNRNYWEEFKQLRNYRLMETDWTQYVSDTNLDEEQKNAWRIYRQALRDLPENISDPKPLAINPDDPNWIQKPY